MYPLVDVSPIRFPSRLDRPVDFMSPTRGFIRTGGSAEEATVAISVASCNDSEIE